MPATMEWVLLSRCPSVGHAELLPAALGKHGLGGEIRGRHLAALEGEQVEAWVQAPNARRANEVLREMEQRSDEASVACAGCGEENPANFETCWSCGALLPVGGREAPAARGSKAPSPVPPTAGLRGLGFSRRRLASRQTPDSTSD
jgi:hypothetical protein